MDTLTSYIKRRLGYPQVDLEIDDDTIKLYCEDSLKRVTPFSNVTEFKEISADRCVPFDAGEVVRVFDNRAIRNNGNDAIFGFDVRVKSQGGVNSVMIDRAIQNYALENRVIEFKQIDDKLYLYNYTGLVTVEYMPKVVSYESLDEKLQTWVKDYTLALCKETIGRVRSKFKSNASPFELDGDTLLNEALDAQRELQDSLRDTGEGFFYVDSF